MVFYYVQNISKTTFYLLKKTKIKLNEILIFTKSPFIKKSIVTCNTEKEGNLILLLGKVYFRTEIYRDFSTKFRVNLLRIGTKFDVFLFNKRYIGCR